MRVTTAILTTLATLGCSGGQTKDGDTDTDGTGETGETGDTGDTGDTDCLSSCCGDEHQATTVEVDEHVVFEDGTVRPADWPQSAASSLGWTDRDACTDACGLFMSSSSTWEWSSQGITDCALTPVMDTDPIHDSDWTSDTDPVTPTAYRVTCSVTGRTVCEGRHHAVLSRAAQGGGTTPLGAWLARAAAAEAGSVHAFRALASELAALGAPAALVDACLDAADDEVRHARDTAWLARRHGGEPAPTPRQPLPARSLRDVALENAIEGCVHETFAAAVAVWQAQHAADPDLRALAAAITPDELRHAELAHALHAWAVSALSPEDAHAVQVAQDRAWDRLICEGTAIDVADDVLDDLGWPDPPTAARLAMGIRARLAVG